MIKKLSVKLHKLRTAMLVLTLFSILCWIFEINGTETGKMDHSHHSEMMPNSEMEMNVSVATEHTSIDMNAQNHIHHTYEHELESHSMHMTFYFGTENVEILFKAWTVNSTGGMVAACLVVCLVAMFYEGLKVLREKLLRKSMVRSKYANVALNSNNLDDAIIAANHDKKQSMFSSPHIIQTFLHLLQVTISYAIMLIFMSYNGYLAISVIVGAGLGYFLFGWKKAVIADINEHCH